MGRYIGKLTGKTADGGTGGGDNHDVLHGYSSMRMLGWAQA
jgi:hypothetical protein